MIVGVTGIAGAGKTTILGYFEELGAKVINVDEIAHEMIHVKNRQIADLIFGDKKLLKQIEAIVHPYVHLRIAEQAVLADEQIILLEMPILFDQNFNRFGCQKIILAYASWPSICNRLTKRGYSQSRISSVAKLESELEKYEDLIDYKINTTMSADDVKRRCELIYNNLILSMKAGITKNARNKKIN